MPKMCKKCAAHKRKHKKSKVSGFDANAAFDFDFMEIAEMAAGAILINVVANPILNAIWDKAKGKVRPSWASLVVKGGLAVGLNSLDNRTAKNAAKGIVINIAAELINKYAPASMQDKLKSDDSVEGIYGDDELQYIDLAGELAGIDESMFTEVSGTEEVYEAVSGGGSGW